VTRRLSSYAAGGVLVGMSSALLAGGFGDSGDNATAAPTACTPSTVVLESPRKGSQEVQVKALNDRGDVVGFADSSDPKAKATHAILWTDGKPGVDLGVLPGYVASEAYGVNNHGVVFGLLYDAKHRTFPFRWENGRMTVLKGLNGRVQRTEVSERNAINDRGQIAATLIIGGQRTAVRWSPDGKATRLPALPGHKWTDVFGINADGVVSGWSRKLASDDGEENPVIWDGAGSVHALKTIRGYADGIAEATNASGLSVGYLGNVGTDGMPGVPNTDPERDNAVVWQTRTTKALLLGPPAPRHGYGELVDVNDRGQAAGMSGSFTNSGFTVFRPVLWRSGWTSMKALPSPAASRKSAVVVTNLNDINARGDIVGNVYGLSGKDFSKLRRIDPVLWKCSFG
jgi:probable HAF family extracellular repeat protein